MRMDGHPFGDLMARLLGLSPFPNPSDSATDFYLSMRNLFIDKMEGGIANQQVTMMQLVDFTRDFFDNVSQNLSKTVEQSLRGTHSRELA